MAYFAVAQLSLERVERVAVKPCRRVRTHARVVALLLDLGGGCGGGGDSWQSVSQTSQKLACLLIRLLGSNHVMY